MELLLSITIFTAFGAGFVFVNMLMGAVARPQIPSPEKAAVYECGEPAIGTSWVQFDLRFYIVAQVDTMAHRIRGFIEKAGRAGVNRVFIGLENINPDSLKDAKKGQNHITQYREMLQAWHAIGALTYDARFFSFTTALPWLTLGLARRLVDPSAESAAAADPAGQDA